MTELLCPVCDQPLDDDALAHVHAAAGSVVPVVDVDLDSDLEEEDTDLEKLEDFIAALEAKAAGRGRNIWTEKQIAELKAYAMTGFDDDGAKIVLLPAPEVVLVQNSPDAALAAEGWWETTAGDPGPLSKKLGGRFRRAGFDLATETLGLSRARSNGCFTVRNQSETSDYFINFTADAAAKTGGSPRILKMVGYALSNLKYMFPTSSMKGAGRFGEGVGDYAPQPDVPFNEWEIDTYREMFYAYHLSGGAFIGASWQQWAVVADMSVARDDRQPVANRNRHRAITYANNPQFILPFAMLRWNTTRFKSGVYANMCRKAHNIDHRNGVPVPGYVTREAQDGGSVSGWEERNGENTAASSKTKPVFVAGSELNLDGTPKSY